MKNVLVAVGVCLVSVFNLAAQWTGTNPGPIYYNGGNVGVGTSTPGAKLDVGAGSTARGGFTDLLIGTGSGTNGDKPQLEFFAPSASAAVNYNGSTLGFWTGGGISWIDALDIDNIGNVGIGTSAPQTRLHVAGSSLFNGIYAGYNDAVSLGNAVNGQMIHFGGTSSADLILASYAPIGKVGIGTTAPDYKLDVNGQIGLSGHIAGRSSQLEFGNSNAIDWLGFPNVNQTYYVSGRADEMQFRTDIETGAFRFKTPSKELLYAQASTGRVGIGTTSPEAKLTVGAIAAGLTNAASMLNSRSASIGNTAGSYVYPFELQTQTSSSLERLQIASYRRVAGADWQGAGWRIQSAVDNSFTDGSRAFIELGPSDPNVSGGGFIAIGTGGQDRLSIASGGNVGIGTSAPSDLLTIGMTGGSGNKLTVNGDVTVTGNIAAKYQDLAEWVPATMTMPPGTVVILNSSRRNEVMPSNRAYDTTVAGVVSAQPGLLLGEAGDSKARIATTGRVKVRVDASKHPVAIGDLLVTSDKYGMAMVSEPLDLGGVKIHRPGTLIGKALEPLANGQGEILVLLSLQ